ncbi:FAD/NAD(P)-binding protein [Sphingobacterium sp. Mn56C]
MIWKTLDMVPEASAGQAFIARQIYRDSAAVLPYNSSAFKIAIVGGGPKGLYALEELLSRLSAVENVGPFEIFWWNETEDFGSGPNYQVEQPDYLLINYCIGHIDAWDRTRQTPEDGLNLVDWIAKFKNRDVEVDPTDYASRALVGSYLQYVAMQVMLAMPANVGLHLLAEEVRSIQTDGTENLLIQTDTLELGVDNVVLCTGHCYRNLPLLDFRDNGIPDNYWINPYPVEQLDAIPAHKSVGVIGWGLTCIDVVLQLSEGRGGYFGDSGDYFPSGNEPVIIPFSRNQLPIMPRGPIFGSTSYTLHYLNQKWLDDMLNLRKQRKINFNTEILPWLEKEIQFAYYSTMLQTREVSKVEAYIQMLPENERFKANDLLFPRIPKQETAQESYISYIDFLIAEAEKGELVSPLMEAAAVWREASPMIASLYAQGGFTGASQQYIDKALFSAFGRTSYGPPIENMKKIRALLKANIMQVHADQNVEVIHQKPNNQFVLQGENRAIPVDYIIDARIARPNLMAMNSNLYHNLLNNNLAKPYANQEYMPGCIAMAANGRVLQAEQDLSLYAYGSNTEGFLLDNDSLSRTKNNLISLWGAAMAERIDNRR